MFSLSSIHDLIFSRDMLAHRGRWIRDFSLSFWLDHLLYPLYNMPVIAG
jgi:hypothetical protein